MLLAFQTLLLDDIQDLFLPRMCYGQRNKHDLCGYDGCLEVDRVHGSRIDLKDLCGVNNNISLRLFLAGTKSLTRFKWCNPCCKTPSNTN